MLIIYVLPVLHLNETPFECLGFTIFVDVVSTLLYISEEITILA